jgi:hypothetical protein
VLNSCRRELARIGVIPSLKDYKASAIIAIKVSICGVYVVGGFFK